MWWIEFYETWSKGCNITIEKVRCSLLSPPLGPLSLQSQFVKLDLRESSYQEFNRLILFSQISTLVLLIWICIIIISCNSSCVENNHYCIWKEEDCYYVEDVSCNVLFPLNLSHLVWFEHRLGELMHSPLQDLFYKQERDVFGTCRIRKEI